MLVLPLTTDYCTLISLSVLRDLNLVCTGPSAVKKDMLRELRTAFLDVGRIPLLANNRISAVTPNRYPLPLRVDVKQQLLFPAVAISETNLHMTISKHVRRGKAGALTRTCALVLAIKSGMMNPDGTFAVTVNSLT
jgi:hypothetical protein